MTKILWGAPYILLKGGDPPPTPHLRPAHPSRAQNQTCSVVSREGQIWDKGQKRWHFGVGEQWKFFREILQKDGRLNVRNEQILVQEPGEFFYPSCIGDLLSPEHKTSTKTQFLFERMQLRSWILKLKTYISTTKCGRMKRL